MSNEQPGAEPDAALVERVARALCLASTEEVGPDDLEWGYGDGEPAWMCWQEDARAAIAAIQKELEAAYKRGWADREGDLLEGVARIYGTSHADDLAAAREAGRAEMLLTVQSLAKTIAEVGDGKAPLDYLPPPLTDLDEALHAVWGAAKEAVREAGRREGLEQAASLCASISTDWETCKHADNPGWMHKAEGADECMEAIRALAQPAMPESQT